MSRRVRPRFFISSLQIRLPAASFQRIAASNLEAGKVKTLRGEQRLSGKGLGKVEGSEVERGSVVETNKRSSLEGAFISWIVGVAGFGVARHCAGIGGAIH